MKQVFRGIISFVALSVSGQSFAAPITFNSALPVGEGRFISRAQLELTRSGVDPSNAGREVDVNALNSVLAYGVSAKLAMFGVLPYLKKEFVQSGSIRRSSSGLGDLTLFGRYTIYQRDMPGRTVRVAGIGGFKAPTGEDDESDGLGRLPVFLQSGTGSWDVFVGGVVSYQTLDYGVDAQLAYRANTEANDFEAGDEVRFDVSLQRRVWPGQLDAQTSGFLYAVLESNVVYRRKDKISGIRFPDSGGTTVFLTPGIQYVRRKLILEAAMQLPVSQELNGNAIENDYVFKTGFRINF